MAYSLVAHVAAAEGSGGTNPSPAIDTTGADLLVAVLSGYSGVTSVSDSKGNTWTPLTQRGSGGSTVRIYYVAAPTVGSGHTFSIGSGGSAPGSLAVMAFSGAAASPFDAENGGQGSGSSVSTGSVTPSQSNCLLVAGVCFYPSGTVSINGGFTVTDQVDYASGGGGQMGNGGAYLIQTSAAAANPAWSQSGFTDAATAIAVFKAVASSSQFTKLAGAGGLAGVGGVLAGPGGLAG